jgi:hypothetical protein
MIRTEHNHEQDYRSPQRNQDDRHQVLDVVGVRLRFWLSSSLEKSKRRDDLLRKLALIPY